MLGVGVCFKYKNNYSQRKQEIISEKNLDLCIIFDYILYKMYIKQNIYTEYTYSRHTYIRTHLCTYVFFIFVWQEKKILSHYYFFLKCRLKVFCDFQIKKIFLLLLFQILLHRCQQFGIVVFFSQLYFVRIFLSCKVTIFMKLNNPYETKI